jgi:Rap1a immunity proteins
VRPGVWIGGVLLCAMTSTGFAQNQVSQDMFQLRNTGDLVALCSANQPDPLFTPAINFCHGYVLGVFSVLQVEEAAAPKARMFCMPNPMPTRQDGITNFVAWARANPGQMSGRPEDGVARFLSQRYPCPQQGSTGRRTGQ